jgi:hypothetical protein
MEANLMDLVQPGSATRSLFLQQYKSHQHHLVPLVDEVQINTVSTLKLGVLTPCEGYKPRILRMCVDELTYLPAVASTVTELLAITIFCRSNTYKLESLQCKTLALSSLPLGHFVELSKCLQLECLYLCRCAWAACDTLHILRHLCLVNETSPFFTASLKLMTRLEVLEYEITEIVGKDMPFVVRDHPTLLRVIYVSSVPQSKCFIEDNPRLEECTIKAKELIHSIQRNPMLQCIRVVDESLNFHVPIQLIREGDSPTARFRFFSE